MADEPKQPSTVFQDDLFDLANKPSQTDSPPAEVSPNDALILPCGATKDPASCAMEAYKRYTGPMWGEVRKNAQALGATEDIPKFLKEGGVDLYILSAEHGLIPADTLIQDYDTEMTPDRISQIKGDKTLTQTITETLSQYDPEKVHLGTPKKYTKLITDVMGRNYNSVFPEGSGQGSQKKGIVDFLKLRLLKDVTKATGQELIPFGEDPAQITLPMDEKKSKKGVASKMWRGIGALARKRGLPIMEIISAAQGAWNEMDPETRQEVTDFMKTPFHELLGMEKGGVDYFRGLVGLPPVKPGTPFGDFLASKDPLGDRYRQLHLVDDTILKEDYETKDKVKNEGIGGLFDFDFGAGASEAQKKKQEEDFELRRRQNIMKKAEDPFETKQVRRYGHTEDRKYKLPSDPLFEVAKVDLEEQMRLRSGRALKDFKFRELMGRDPKYWHLSGNLPRGYSEKDLEWLRKEGLIYEQGPPPVKPQQAGHLTVDRPVEKPESNRGAAGQIGRGREAYWYENFKLEDGEGDEIGLKYAPHGDDTGPENYLWLLNRKGEISEFALERHKESLSGDFKGFREAALKQEKYMNIPALRKLAEEHIVYNQGVMDSYKRNLENIDERIERMTTNPALYGLDFTGLEEDIKAYRNFAIPSINERVGEIADENANLQRFLNGEDIYTSEVYEEYRLKHRAELEAAGVEIIHAGHKNSNTLSYHQGLRKFLSGMKGHNLGPVFDLDD